MRAQLGIWVFLVITCATSSSAAFAQAPMKLVRRIKMPQVALSGTGLKNFDALTADVKTNRLFIAAQWHGSVEVYDLKKGKLIHSITGIGRPLDILYLPELDRIYVTDGTGTPTTGYGASGAVRIYDGKTYKEIRKVDLLSDTDAISYDPDTKLLYVKNGGEDARVSYSDITILNTDGDKVGDIRLESDTIGDVILEGGSPRLFVPDTDKTRKTKIIRVFDRNTHELLASWPDSHSTHDGVMDLDEKNHRLFAGEPEGVVTVYDTETGKEVTTFPIGKGMDGLDFDEDTKRIYIPCGDDGMIYVFQEEDPDHYKFLGKVASGHLARGGTLVPELHRYFTAVPQHDDVDAELLEYEVK